MTKEKEKIEKIQGLLEEASTLLAELQVQEEGLEAEIPSWMKDRMELWSRIYNEANGAPIPKERVDELWVEMGKDKKGSAGFFTGKRASLQWTHDNKVSLSYWADKQVKDLTGKSLEEYAKSFKAKKGKV